MISMSLQIPKPKTKSSFAALSSESLSLPSSSFAAQRAERQYEEKRVGIVRPAVGSLSLAVPVPRLGPPAATLPLKPVPVQSFSLPAPRGVNQPVPRSEEASAQSIEQYEQEQAFDELPQRISPPREAEEQRAIKPVVSESAMRAKIAQEDSKIHEDKKRWNSEVGLFLDDIKYAKDKRTSSADTLKEEMARFEADHCTATTRFIDLLCKPEALANESEREISNLKWRRSTIEKWDQEIHDRHTLAAAKSQTREFELYNSTQPLFELIDSVKEYVALAETASEEKISS